jgi:hypothetical protein
MDYTEIIKKIKNKLKKHESKNNIIIEAIELDTKIKNDLETNFKKRINFLLTSTEAAKDLIDVTNKLETALKKYKLNKKNKI